MTKSFSSKERVLLLSILGYVYKRIENKDFEELSFQSQPNENLKLLTDIASKVILMDSSKVEQSNIHKKMQDVEFKQNVLKGLGF